MRRFRALALWLTASIPSGSQWSFGIDMRGKIIISRLGVPKSQTGHLHGIISKSGKERPSTIGLRGIPSNSKAGPFRTFNVHANVNAQLSSFKLDADG